MAERYRRIPSIDDTVVVVGAGIAGSTAALELSRLGQKTTIIEKMRPHGNGSMPGQERSEMTLSKPIVDIGASEGIVGPLTQVVFISLDTGAKFSHSLPQSTNVPDNVAVSIDHGKVLHQLWRKMSNQQNITSQTGARVDSIRDLPGGEGVEVKINGETQYVKAVVNAAGPSWRRLPFSNADTQRSYENGTVAVAYGRRCRGRINLPDGDKTMLHPVSAKGSGRTSWVNAVGPDQIDIIFSDYSTRNSVGKVNRDKGYNLLLHKLLEMKLVTLYEEGPVICGFFGLDARLTHSGDQHIYHFGERGQYNSATVGDAIAPTLRLAAPLANIIVQGKRARDFEKITQSQFNHRLEMATTNARRKAPEMGKAFDLFHAVKWLSERDQIDFLRTHKIPVHVIPRLIMQYPHLIGNLASIAQEYVALSF